MSKLKAAQELEQLRVARLIEELNKEEQARVTQINADMSSRGVFHSGMRIHAVAAARADKIRRIIDGRLKIRKELGQDFPELCSDDSLKELLTQFFSMIDHAFTALHQGLELQIASTLAVRDDQEEYKLRAYANTEIEILRRELTLNLSKKAADVPTVSVTTSGGSAIVNLGAIYGNVQQSIGHVEQTGNRELAALLAELAAAITGTEALGEDRAVYLDQVQFIAEQAAETADKRKTSLVRGIFLGLQTSLQNVANLAQVSELVGPVLAQHFGLPWPL